MAALKRRERNEQLVLVMLVVAMAAALANDFRSPLAWILLAPCLFSFFRQIASLPAWLSNGVQYAAWTLVAAAAAMVRIFPANQIFSPPAFRGLEEFTGYSLLVLCVLFLAGRKVWRPGFTLFPAACGALALVAMNNTTNLDVPLILAGPATFFYLAITARARPDAESRSASGSQQFLRLCGAGVAVFLLAGAIITVLPWAQVQFEQVAFQFFNMDVTQYSSLSLESRLGDIEQLLLSPRVIMRVYSTRAQKLRGRVFTRFDGQMWHARMATGRHIPAALSRRVADPDLRGWLEEIPGEEYPIPPHEPADAAEPGVIRTRIVQTVFNQGLLAAPGGKLLVRVPLPSLRLDLFEGLETPLSSDVEIYGVVNRRDDDALFVAQPGSPPPEVIVESLAIPADTDARFREVAARLVADSPSADERLRRTVEYVKGAARYSLRVGRFHSLQPAAEFFFEKKQGYCQYLATAAAILLRLEGVPTRYVTGFEVEEGNREGGHYVVRELDAHAWIEAYIPGRGWIEADPTPEAEYESLHAGANSGWISSAREWIAAKWTELSIRVRGGDWLASWRWIWGQIKSFASAMSWKDLGIGIVFAVLAALAVRLVWRRRRGKRATRRAIRGERAPAQGVARELAELLVRLDGTWTRAGVRRPPTQAPLEHLSSIAPEKISSALHDASRRAIECYYGARYAGFPITDTDIANAQEALERASLFRHRRRRTTGD